VVHEENTADGRRGDILPPATNNDGIAVAGIRMAVDHRRTEGPSYMTAALHKQAALGDTDSHYSPSQARACPPGLQSNPPKNYISGRQIQVPSFHLPGLYDDAFEDTRGQVMQRL
jgi:hypothetical protein